MKDVTVVIVAFNRDLILKGCLRSIRKCYPDIKIIISDNGNSKHTNRMARHFDCEHLKLPYDCGANQARKLGQAAVKTRYWVIGEDDFIFTQDTQLERFEDILDHDQEVDLIGGLAIRGNRLGTIGSTFSIDRKIRTFYRDPVRMPDFRQAGPLSYYLCDYTRMFFMARKEIPIDWEVGEYLGSGTHISITLKNFLKKGSDLPWYQAAFTHSVAVSHVQAHESETYRKQRSRVRTQMSLLYRDTGLRYGVFDQKRVRDYRHQVSISMEEWRRRTGK